ncbi:MAG: hypothetical protein ACRC9Y_10110, partial [Aeromonas veronii]
DDAPNDGKKYVRSNLVWEELTGGSGGGIPEAPTDGKEYVRKMSAWSPVNSDGIVLPASKGIKYTNAAGDEKNLISKDSLGISIAGEDDNVRIHGSNVTIGSDDSQVILKYTDTKNASVSNGVDTHEILHAGNFPDAPSTKPMVRVRGAWENLSDYLPLKMYGGYQVVSNDTATVVSSTPTAIALNSGRVSPLALNTIDVSEDDGKLTFDQRASGVVVNAVLDFRVTTDVVQNTTFSIRNKAGVILTVRNIMTEEWSAGKSGFIRIQLPIQLGNSEELTVMIGADSSANVTITEGIFYINSI